MLEAGAVELDELADDAMLAEPLGDRQHEIGRRRAFEHFARQAESEHLRNQHRNRLAEHRGFGFDATDAPAHDAKTIHHRRVRVRADERVGISERPVDRVGRHDDSREILEIHLVNDARVRRHDPEVAEGVLAPAQKRVAFLVSRELELGVQLKRVLAAEVIDLHRVIDHQFDRLQGVHLVRVAAEPGDAVAHCGEIDDGRHAGEIL